MAFSNLDLENIDQDYQINDGFKASNCRKTSRGNICFLFASQGHTFKTGNGSVDRKWDRRRRSTVLTLGQGEFIVSYYLSSVF
jgi:hypothetical protein